MERFTVRFVTLLTLGTLTLAATGCRGGDAQEEGGETISRARFIETYVELRLAGLRSGDPDLTLDGQREVLDRMGVTEDEMIAFVEHWGTDGDLMVGIWEEVDSLLRETRMSEGEEAELRPLEEMEGEVVDRPNPRGGGGDGQGVRP